MEELGLDEAEDLIDLDLDNEVEDDNGTSTQWDDDHGSRRRRQSSDFPGNPDKNKSDKSVTFWHSLLPPSKEKWYFINY